MPKTTTVTQWKEMRSSHFAIYQGSIFLGFDRSDGASRLKQTKSKIK